MKSPHKTSGLILLILSFFIIYSCKKDKPALAVLTTTPVIEITDVKAVSGGDITDDRGGPITARGVCWSTSQNPTISDNKTADGAGKGVFTSSINGLTATTTYYLRAYATNSAGTSYGNEISFKTFALAVLTTIEATEITDIKAISGGDITDDGGGSITARGVCWSYSQNPTISDNKTADGSGKGVFTSSVSGLAGMTTYYLRAYATNNAGTSYGNQISFKTFAISDVDGNLYNSITIGAQTWLATNLKVTHYRNNEPITNVTDNLAWSSLTTGAYCDYNNNPDTSKTYGRLYNFYTTVDQRRLCPEGWHVPNDEEWTILSDYLGGESIAGGKMKETGLVHWLSPNTGATNSIGFTALAAGQRKTDGTFTDFGIAGIWWSCTPYNYEKPYYRSAAYSNVILFRGFGTLNNVGMSIRCLKN